VTPKVSFYPKFALRGNYWSLGARFYPWIEVDPLGLNVCVYVRPHGRSLLNVNRGSRYTYQHSPLGVCRFEKTYLGHLKYLLIKISRHQDDRVALNFFGVGVEESQRIFSLVSDITFVSS
jgi:hypothetical protein